METWKILLFTISLLLSIIIPIYYSQKKRNLQRKLKEGREVSEREKIRVYIDNINEKFRAKYR